MAARIAMPGKQVITTTDKSVIPACYTLNILNTGKKNDTEVDWRFIVLPAIYYSCNCFDAM
jgi:hypothetical protein